VKQLLQPAIALNRDHRALRSRRITFTTVGLPWGEERQEANPVNLSEPLEPDIRGKHRATLQGSVAGSPRQVPSKVHADEPVTLARVIVVAAVSLD
jgi:hypothetical protein